MLHFVHALTLAFLMTATNALAGQQRKTVDDYVQSADNGDYALAVTRAAGAGVTELVFPGGTQYTFKTTALIPNGNIRLVADSRKTVEIRLLGTATDTFFEVGNASAMSYNFYADGFLFTKEQQASSGAIFRMRNLYKWGFTNSRIYGENKIWRILELTSVSSGISYNIDVDNIRERAVYGTVGSTGACLSAGAVNGRMIDNDFDMWYVTTALQNPTDPTTDGVFYFDDCFEANWITNAKISKHKGYAFYFKGSSTNINSNVLNLIFNPNVESSLAPSGIAYFGYVAASQIGGPAAWSSVTSRLAGGGNAVIPGIYLSSVSGDNTVRGLQIGIQGQLADGVLDQGQYNIIEDIEGVGYPDNDGVQRGAAVVVLGPGAIGSEISRIKAQNLLNVIRNDSGPQGGHTIDGVTFFSLRGPALAGLSSGSINSVSNVRDKGSATVVYFAPATSIVLSPGKKLYVATGGGTIDRMDPGYFGEVRTLQLSTVGTVVRDLSTTGLASGAGGFLTKTGSNYTTGSARDFQTFQWQGAYWQQM